MPRLTGYRSTPPDLAERRLEQFYAGFRQHERKIQKMPLRTGRPTARRAAYSAARPNGGPLTIGEFIPHDSSLPLGSLKQGFWAFLPPGRLGAPGVWCLGFTLLQLARA
jgi:hypothetical protein